jgi:predicted RNA-binding Zn-ribbon protein involved in translation (DUF1610 family)
MKSRKKFLYFYYLLIGKMYCPECGSEKIKLMGSETICVKCGLVISEKPFSGSKIV